MEFCCQATGQAEGLKQSRTVGASRIVKLIRILEIHNGSLRNS